MPKGLVYFLSNMPQPAGFRFPCQGVVFLVVRQVTPDQVSQAIGSERVEAAVRSAPGPEFRFWHLTQKIAEPSNN